MNYRACIGCGLVFATYSHCRSHEDKCPAALEAEREQLERIEALRSTWESVL